MATAEAAPVRTAVISVPSMSASGCPGPIVEERDRRLVARQTDLVVAGEDRDELRLEDPVRVAGHRRQKAPLRLRRDAGRNGGATGAQLDEHALERVEELLEVEQPANLGAREDEHGQGSRPSAWRPSIGSCALQLPKLTKSSRDLAISWAPAVRSRQRKDSARDGERLGILVRERLLLVAEDGRREHVQKAVLVAVAERLVEARPSP